MFVCGFFIFYFPPNMDRISKVSDTNDGFHQVRKLLFQEQIRRLAVSPSM